ncbi:hypothetical protein TSMEX_002354 [Taenia solium]|eukprot:TsM_001122600 transcript=TsM_001122600 gene=TsM_001122600
MDNTSQELALKKDKYTDLNRKFAFTVCIVVIAYSTVMIILILNHFRKNSRLLRGFPANKKQCQDAGAVLNNEFARLNFVLLLSLLELDPFPGGRTPSSEVSDTSAVFNAAISGILRQTMRGKSLPRSVEFFRRCLQLLETDSVIGMDEIAAQDMAGIERRLAQLEAVDEQPHLMTNDSKRRKSRVHYTY